MRSGIMYILTSLQLTIMLTVYLSKFLLSPVKVHCALQQNYPRTSGPWDEEPYRTKSSPYRQDMPPRSKSKILKVEEEHDEDTGRFHPWLYKYELVTQLVQQSHRSDIVIDLKGLNMEFRVHVQECPYSMPTVHLLKNDGDMDIKTDIFHHFCGYEEHTAGEVHGYFENELFVGVIHAPDDDFFIERSNVLSHQCFLYKASNLNLTALEDAGINAAPVIHLIGKKRRSRSKRSTNLGKSCYIHAYADHTFFQFVGGSSLSSTVNKIYYYILEANRIFVSTDFNGDGVADGNGVNLEKVTIMQDSAASSRGWMVPAERSATTILNMFSRNDHEDYCLAALFTSRDLNSGVIGLAWMASSSFYDYPGGICQKRLSYQGQAHSFNAFLVTSVNFGRMLPDIITALTTTHELGHSFGSPHDTGRCSVDSPAGFYIMYPQASDSTRPNNKVFSRCSNEYIAPVIVNKGHCLAVARAPRCGDGVIQGEEQCDCGEPMGCEAFDPCCFPVTDFQHACMLRNSSVCSPAVSPCCSRDCTILQTERLCRRPSACMEGAECDGLSHHCPMARPKPDGTLCLGGTFLCRAGTCGLSRCSVLAHEPCSCTHSTEMECQLCCLSNSGRCAPALELGLDDGEGRPLYLRAGSACRQNTGFCNQNHECVRPDREDTIDRLRDLLRPSIKHRIREWLEGHWPLLLVIIIMLIFLVISSRVLFKLNARPTLTTLAHQAVRMSVLWQQARFELDNIKEELAVLNQESSWYQIMDQDMQNNHQFVEELARMQLFFPTAPRSIIGQSVTSCTSEVQAVEKLLELGYPMIKLSSKFHQSPTIEI